MKILFNPFTGTFDFVGNSGGGGGTTITVVTNYSALPPVATVSGQFFWCSNSQGTKWLPGSLGGTYYSAGLYYSNGVTWEYLDVPYQATQSDVNTGTNNDQFVTPLTFTNATKWGTKQDALISGTNIKTVNGNSLLGSGNVVVGDVLIGGNTTGADITIGNNDNFNLSLRTNNIIRQTIANDGLVTFEGTSGNAGIVQMRQLKILDFDGVTWRPYLSSPSSSNMTLGHPSVNLTITAPTLVISNATRLSSFAGLFQSSNIAPISASQMNIGSVTNTSSNPMRIGGVYISSTYLTSTAIAGFVTPGVQIISAANTDVGGTGQISIITGANTGGGNRGDFLLSASNYSFNVGTSPNYQSMIGGVYFANGTAPSGNPTNGYFNWAEGGDFKLRTSGGAIASIGDTTTFGGNASIGGTVRMKTLQILDFDGVTWRNALIAGGSSNQLSVGSSFVTTIIGLTWNVTGTTFGAINTGTSTIQGGNAGLTVTTNQGAAGGAKITISTATTAGTGTTGNTGDILNITGNVTNAGATGSVGSWLFESGTNAGTGVRGNFQLFGGSTLVSMQSMQRGMFIGNATAAPTGNPTDGYFNWGEGGDVKFRTSGGAIASIGDTTTFGGNSSLGGVVRMRQLQVLDFDGVTWRNGIISTSITNQLVVGSGLSRLYLAGSILSIDSGGSIVNFGSGNGTFYTSNGILTVNGTLGAVLRTQSLSTATTNVQILTGDSSYSNSSSYRITGHIINKTGDWTGLHNADPLNQTGNITFQTGAITNSANTSPTGYILFDTGANAGTGGVGNVCFFKGTVITGLDYRPSVFAGGMQKGFYIGNAISGATSNPSNGYFNWAESGNPKFRTSGGDVITLAKQTAVTTAQGIADALTAVGLLDTSTISSSGVSDGDKGDITVSSGGTVWTIDNATVTPAKIAATGTPSSSTYLRGDGVWDTPAGGSGFTCVTATLDFVFGDEENSVINTVSSAVLTTSNFRSFTIVPISTTGTSLDDFALNGVTFNVENIINTTSFDIRATSINNASGTYRITYYLNYQ